MNSLSLSDGRMSTEYEIEQYRGRRFSHIQSDIGCFIGISHHRNTQSTPPKILIRRVFRSTPLTNVPLQHKRMVFYTNVAEDCLSTIEVPKQAPFILHPSSLIGGSTHVQIEISISGTRTTHIVVGTVRMIRTAALPTNQQIIVPILILIPNTANLSSQMREDRICIGTVCNPRRTL